MGCDIHATLEYEPFQKFYKESLSGTYTPHWVAFAGTISISRNYKLFAALADVRNDGSVRCILPPRGVPEDASWEYKELVEKWEGDSHSYSWFTFAELKRARFGHRTEDWYKVAKLLAEKYGSDNVRLCFFFDN